MIFMLITRKNVDTLLQIIAVGIDVNMMIIILIIITIYLHGKSYNIIILL